MSAITADQINALLPQTQCTKCGFNGCKPYAQAIADHSTTINRCSPGGEETVEALAKLCGQDPIPLAQDVLPTLSFSTAVIDEERCIGCALCLKACPVDAIIGTRKMMHTVINDWCTGCELCLPPCPVDCISIVKKSDSNNAPSANENLQRYEHHQKHYLPQDKAVDLVKDKNAILKAALERSKSKNL